MYFAQMYCYGFDVDIVGITGIVTCMGVVYVGNGAMYAVHIPYQSDTKNALGGTTFANWVAGQQQNLGPGHGHLLVFANGRQRPGADAEALAIKNALNAPPTALYRIMKHLGPQSGGLNANSAAIKVERVHATKHYPEGVKIKYHQDHQKIAWIDGAKQESGVYDPTYTTSFSGTKRPKDIKNWWPMTGSNCTVTVI